MSFPVADDETPEERRARREREHDEAMASTMRPINPDDPDEPGDSMAARERNRRRHLARRGRELGLND